MKGLLKRKINDHLQNVSKRRKLYKSEFVESESLSEFEKLCLKIPLVSKHVFNSIDDETFFKCNMNSRPLHLSTSSDRSYWIRILRRDNENFREFSDTWKKAICKTPTEIVKKLALAAINFHEEFEEHCSQNG